MSPPDTSTTAASLLADLHFRGSHHTKSKFEDTALTQTPYFIAGKWLARVTRLGRGEPALEQTACPALSLKSPPRWPRPGLAQRLTPPNPELSEGRGHLGQVGGRGCPRWNSGGRTGPARSPSFRPSQDGAEGVCAFVPCL